MGRFLKAAVLGVSTALSVMALESQATTSTTHVVMTDGQTGTYLVVLSAKELEQFRAASKKAGELEKENATLRECVRKGEETIHNYHNALGEMYWKIQQPSTWPEVPTWVKVVGAMMGVMLTITMIVAVVNSKDIVGMKSKLTCIQGDLMYIKDWVDLPDQEDDLVSFPKYTTSTMAEVPRG